MGPSSRDLRPLSQTSRKRSGSTPKWFARPSYMRFAPSTGHGTSVCQRSKMTARYLIS